MGIAAQQPPDPVIYREEDDVGEHEIQTYILELLRPLVERYLRERAEVAHVGSDQFIYWRQYDAQACVAPDLYILPGVSQEIAIGAWKAWEHGVVPDFALEVVGRDPQKDYEDAPRRYAELGVGEVLVFDPFPDRDRVAFTVYRREGGVLKLIEATRADRVWSDRLGCFVRRIGADATTRLRLGLGERGDELFPTGEEAERAAKEEERAAKEEERAAKEEERAAKEEERAAKEEERAAKEEERAAKEEERAAKEEERAAKEAALRRIAELEAELAKRR